MKREIKFRAWHKVQKQMFTALYLTFSGRIGVWNNNETEIDFISEYPYLELMQFTGLKDKNGKEIYEGDILESASWTKNTRQKHPYHLVEWKGAAWVATEYNGTMKVSPDLDVKNDWEVISNIYENPELLK